jgi:hypothetical protein
VALPLGETVRACLEAKKGDAASAAFERSIRQLEANRTKRPDLGALDAAVRETRAWGGAHGRSAARLFGLRRAQAAESTPAPPKGRDRARQSAADPGVVDGDPGPGLVAHQFYSL